jgi:O-antigen ligase
MGTDAPGLHASATPHAHDASAAKHAATPQAVRLVVADVKPPPNSAAAWAVQATVGLAVAMPLLVAFNVAPSPTILNQLAAVGLWGAALLTLAALGAQPRRTSPDHLVTPSSSGAWHATRWLLSALLLAGLFALGGTLWSSVGLGLAVSATGLLAMAAMLVLVGAASAQRPWLHGPVLRGLSWGWVLLGVVSSGVALMQVFAPAWADGNWIAQSAIPGRAVGNVRQPNHLATLMLGACAALVPLSLMLARQTKPVQPTAAATRSDYAAKGPLPWWPSLLFPLFVFVIVLTGSRTGVVGMMLLALWGLLDRALPGRWRVGLLLGPLWYVLSWLGMAQWASSTGGTFGAAARLGEADMSSSRFAILRDTVTLIGQQPWFGVGFGEFNLAWSMTPLPQRPVAFFDHSHNLPLQLAVELGVPVALLVLTLLGAALWQAYRRTRTLTTRTNAADTARGNAANALAMRALFLMLLLMAVHSQFEYPLWYAHFLLPTAFMWGLCLGWSPRAEPTTPAEAPTVTIPQPSTNATSDNTNNHRRHSHTWPWAAAGLLMTVLTITALRDYQKVVAIFEPQDRAAPLQQRIADGQGSWFFAHHANYAWGTTADLPGQAMPGFDGAKHYLLDARLMMAWAQGYAEQGDLERARHIADRLREFRNPATQAWFAECQSNAFVQPPFQCIPASKDLNWRAFR